MAYAKGTQVSTTRSQEEVQRMILRFGATEFGTLMSDRSVTIGFFIRKRQVRFTLPLPDRNDKAFQRTPAGRKTISTDRSYVLWEQACRERWRALAAVIKAKFVAVDSGIVSFEDEFLAHFVTTDGTTVSEFLKPKFEQFLAGPRQLALPAGGA